MKKFFRENGLSIAFLFLFVISICGQAFTGYHDYLSEIREWNKTLAKEITFTEYLKSGHFIQATFENWESEFLQMALFVILTIFLKQKGSSESKKINETNKTDKIPNPKRRNAPWPVKKGGIILKLYENSLSIALLLLFFLSWALHFFGSLKDENMFRSLRNEPAISVAQYLTNSRQWFESFQNWQSEFLSVFALIVLSIYFRQKGSSQSKAVDAPYDETGE